MRSLFLIVASWICLVVMAVAAQSHDMKMTGIKVRLDADSVTVSVQAHLHQLGNADPATALRQRLHLRLDGKPFVPESSNLMRDSFNGIAIWQGKRSGAAATVQIDAPLFTDQKTGGTVVTLFKGGLAVGEALVNADHPTASIDTAATGSADYDKATPRSSAAMVVARFVREGVLHILLGPDHILFILGLLLLGGGLKQLLKVVTAFTLAHSVTLTLAATGTFILPSRLVEPLIALSIVAVAAENLRPHDKAQDWRPWLAFGFGLIHGFGFAGVLAEVSLPRETLGWALAAFNIGVEMGQAAIVLIAAPTLALLAQWRPRFGQRLVFNGSLAVAAMGAFWFVQRIL